MLWIIGDDNRDRRHTPWVTYALLAINIFVFFYLQECGANHAFTYAYSTVPAEIVEGRDIVIEQHDIPHQESPTPIYLTIITALFLHGGLLHLFGNMLYLFVFGDNVEDRLGKIRYLIFYLLCGIAATCGHIAFSYATGQNTLTPLLGASGAISGLLAGYVFLFPKKRVTLLLWLLIYIRRFRVPAIFVISIWFALQLVSGYMSVDGDGGVAYMAHIAGFLCGILLILGYKATARRERKS